MAPSKLEFLQPQMFPNDARFHHKDVRFMFRNKTVVVLGDSIQRSVYKDLVCLWNDNNSRYLQEDELRAKGELSFLGDQLLIGGQLAKKVNGIQYREVREFRDSDAVFRFYFITRCFNDYVESILKEFESLKPDILIINSCCWDIHHYGKEGKLFYRDNLARLFSCVSSLPSNPLLVWNSALPLADYCKGGFLRQGFKTLPPQDVVWANFIASGITEEFKYIYNDLFNSLNSPYFIQAEDGIHWGKEAHRKISNCIMTELCQYWKIPIGNPSFKEHSWTYPYFEDNSQNRVYPFGPQPLLPNIRSPGIAANYPLPFATPPARFARMRPMYGELPRHFSDPLPYPRVSSYQSRQFKQGNLKRKLSAVQSLGTPLSTPMPTVSPSLAKLSAVQSLGALLPTPMPTVSLSLAKLDPMAASLKIGSSTSPVNLTNGGHVQDESRKRKRDDEEG